MSISLKITSGQLKVGENRTATNLYAALCSTSTTKSVRQFPNVYKALLKGSTRMQEWRDKIKQVWLVKKLFWWQTSPFDTPQEEHPAVKLRPADAVDYLTFRKASLTFIFRDMETARDSNSEYYVLLHQIAHQFPASSSFTYTHPRNHLGSISRIDIRIILLVTSPVSFNEGISTSWTIFTKAGPKSVMSSFASRARCADISSYVRRLHGTQVDFSTEIYIYMQYIIYIYI